MTVPLPPKLYFRIGEVAGLVGVEPHVLRYWEREFRSIRPTKSAKGQRVYSRKDVEALIVVKDLLYAQGFTIAGAKKRLQRTPGQVSGQASSLSPAASGGSPAVAAAASRSGLRSDTPVADHEVVPELTPDLAPLFMDRHAEEALLRTLERQPPQHQVRAHAQTDGHAQLHAQPPMQAQPQTQAQALAGSRTQADRERAHARSRSDGESTRKALISLRAEVEAMLSELGG